MERVVLFIKKDFNHIMDAADLTDGGSKVFGDVVIAETEKKDVKKLIKGRIIAAYCDGKVAIKKGIKSLSDGKTFMSADYFEEYSKQIVEGEEARERLLL